jgi:hypothetical protein
MKFLTERFFLILELSVFVLKSTSQYHFNSPDSDLATQMKTDLYGSGLGPLKNNSTKVHQNKLNVVGYGIVQKVQDSDSGSANLRKHKSGSSHSHDFEKVILER